MEIKKPAKFNGSDFIKELEKVGIIIDKVKDNGEGILSIDVQDNKKSIVESVLDAHAGNEYPDYVAINRQSALSKLIDLGLTEDEAKAFLG